jgi:hypothetical protein
MEPNELDAAERGRRQKIADCVRRLDLWAEESRGCGDLSEAHAYTKAAAEVNQVAKLCWADFDTERDRLPGGAVRRDRPRPPPNVNRAALRRETYERVTELHAAERQATRDARVAIEQGEYARAVEITLRAEGLRALARGLLDVLNITEREA